MARLEAGEIDERLRALDGWERSGEAIRKEFANGDFTRRVA